MYWLIKVGDLYISMTDKGYTFFQTKDKAHQYKNEAAAISSLNEVRKQLNCNIGTIIKVTFNEVEIP